MTFDSTEMRALAARRLRYAIAASVFLHILVLWSGAVRVLTKDTPPVLNATLLPSPQRPIEPVATAKPPPPAVSPAPTFEKPAPTPRQRVLEQASQDLVPPVTAPAVPPIKPIPATDETAVALAPPSVTAPAGAVSGVLITEASASGEVVDGLRGYRLAVASQARRFKRYPAQAMASGWEGSADIRVEVGGDGRPRTATVVRSSGHDLLDRAALAMIDAGALRARLPESLRGKAFAVVLPVVFNLDDQ